MLRRTHRLGGLDSIVRPEVAGALWPRRFGPDRRAWKVRARDLLVFDIELVNLKVAPSEAENAAATLEKDGSGVAFLILVFPPQSLVEEAVTVGDLVRLFTFRQGNANLVELTLPVDSPYVGKPTGLIPFPENCALVSILRDGQVYVPDAEQPIESGDELLFVVPEDREDELEVLLAPNEHGKPG